MQQEIFRYVHATTYFTMRSIDRMLETVETNLRSSIMQLQGSSPVQSRSGVHLLTSSRFEPLQLPKKIERKDFKK